MVRGKQPMRLILTALGALLLGASLAGAAELPKDIRVGPGTLVVAKKDMLCLALNDYWEARGETLQGRVAVAQVVLNRARDPRFPGSICDVVQENRSGMGRGCQFSWYCDGKADAPIEEDAWRSSVLLAMSVLRRDNAINDPTRGALWYHNGTVAPSWADRLDRTVRIGTHVFYTDTVGRRPATQTAKRDTGTSTTTGTPVPSTFADWIDTVQKGEQVAGQ
ncbi:Cell wall hydrolase, SleB [Rhodospirillum rubrum ATCC 11170]|uniref:Cell wall hydrolase, SleB n=2 Tax=Rhodospirillum rubrum TaxID=1085 RepID=Q2RV49_RHORT|nr:Cell wall hydrolase, SleB [Rhodospirillum rubrum ATCC 11170]MBK5953577.1 cell wall hydrolase [Rhodospirillum rubrum]HAP99151.1 cell wall hydrolase [Rhodospirillum rubrum]HCF18276.1 cell wall hydrolase [Rhodospirillum rubrum]